MNFCITIMNLKRRSILQGIVCKWSFVSDEESNALQCHPGYTIDRQICLAFTGSTPSGTLKSFNTPGWLVMLQGEPLFDHEYNDFD
jgi:hypothetical protein